MEQPIDQGVARQSRVEHFPLGRRGHQDHCFSEIILALFAVDIDAAGVELRHLLHHQGRRAPLADAPVFTAPRHDLDAGRQLLGLAEIGVRAIGERGAFERHDALIALGMLALVDREGEPAVAEQARHVALGRFRTAAQRHGELPGIELGIAAQRTIRREIGDQQADRAIAGDLQGEDAVILERRGERTAQHHRLGQRPRHGERIAVAPDHRIQRRAETHEAAAYAQRIELEGESFVPISKRRAGGR